MIMIDFAKYKAKRKKRLEQIALTFTSHTAFTVMVYYFFIQLTGGF